MLPPPPQLPGWGNGAESSHCNASLIRAGREHLLFYARIKNLRGKALRRAVDDGLRAVNLFSVGDDLVGGYRWVGWRQLGNVSADQIVSAGWAMSWYLTRYLTSKAAGELEYRFPVVQWRHEAPA